MPNAYEAAIEVPLAPLSPDDLTLLYEIIRSARQLADLIEKAKYIGLPVEEHEQRNKNIISVATKTIEKIFPSEVGGGIKFPEVDSEEYERQKGAGELDPNRNYANGGAKVEMTDEGYPRYGG